MDKLKLPLQSAETKRSGYKKKSFTMMSSKWKNVKTKLQVSEISEDFKSQPHNKGWGAFTSLFIKPKKKEKKKLGSQKVKKLFLKAKHLIFCILSINSIIEDIVRYGTSTNLYDLRTRPREYVQQMLYPEQLKKNVIVANEITKIWQIHPSNRYYKA